MRNERKFQRRRQTSKGKAKLDTVVKDLLLILCRTKRPRTADEVHGCLTRMGYDLTLFFVLTALDRLRGLKLIEVLPITSERQAQAALAEVRAVAAYLKGHRSRSRKSSIQYRATPRGITHGLRHGIAHRDKHGDPRSSTRCDFRR